MLTVPQTVPKKAIKCMIAHNDVKRWVIAKETGHGGYKHWQIRLETSNPDFFAYVKKNIPSAHVEEARDVWEYERKEGHFWTSEDTNEIRKVRFGTPNDRQRAILRMVGTQNDRQIDVWYDPRGNNGKTWLSIHLWEQGRALVVPRASCTAHELSAFVCSAYKGEEFIIIDIPRASKPNVALYEAMEEIKDGLVFDHRYHGQCRNVRGAKIIVFTNTKLNTEMLSPDRWRLHGFGRTSS